MTRLARHMDYVDRMLEGALSLPQDRAARPLLESARHELDQARRELATAAELERARARLRGGA